MSEHGSLAAMLAILGFEAAILGLALGFLTYWITGNLGRVEDGAAAMFLEARRVLGQSR